MWFIPDDQGKFRRELMGTIELLGSRQPTGVIDGHDAFTTAEGGLAFPQYRHFEYLNARLDSGSTVLLVAARVAMLLPGRTNVVSDYAIVSPGMLSLDYQDRHSVAVIQVSGLDTIAGAGPLQRTMQALSHGIEGEKEWRFAKSQDAGVQRWADDQGQLELQFDLSIDYGGMFRFAHDSSPKLVVSTTELPLTTLQAEWVIPLQRIVSLLSARPESITCLMTKRTPRSEQEAKHVIGREFVFFGPEITQQPYAADDRVAPPPVAASLAGDNINLLTMLRSWQGLAARAHPLLATFGAFITEAPQHPRSRFLLLIQAIEGSYGFEHRAQREADEQEHRTAYDNAMSEISSGATSQTLQFIKKNLNKKPPTNLDGPLQSVVTGLPIDITAVLADTGLVKRVLQENVPGVTTAAGALRTVRNHLAHGFREYDYSELQEAADVLEFAVRAHLLTLLGCPEVAVRRLLSYITSGRLH